MAAQWKKQIVWVASFTLLVDFKDVTSVQMPLYFGMTIKGGIPECILNSQSARTKAIGTALNLPEAPYCNISMEALA